MSPTIIVAYLALFTFLGFAFLFVNLLIGKFCRPDSPNTEKKEVYECGEPTIGSSFVQFDLRFYVVALLFIIFDVEIAFFFPWATVFGKGTQLMDPNVALVQTVSEGKESTLALTPAAANEFRELGVSQPSIPRPSEDLAANEAAVRESARTLTLISIGDILAFFAVLMVGFAYVWRRGDLDWVRAVTPERPYPADRPVIDFTDEDEPALV